MLGRVGSDLLSRALRQSTIGAEAFHVRVREGIGCFILAITTDSSKHMRPFGRKRRFCHRVILSTRSKILFMRTAHFAVLSLRVNLLLFISEEISKRGQFKPIEILVPVSFICYHTSTSGLSTW